MVNATIIGAFMSGMFAAGLFLGPLIFRIHRLSRENRTMLRMLVQASNGIDTDQLEVDDIYP
jgi:hypothetical protein